MTDPVPLTTTPTELNTENIYGTTGIEKGKVKTSKTRVLDNTNTWLQATFVYDAFGRTSSASGNNHLLPADLNAEAMTFQYDYADNILTDTRTSKKTASASYSITQKHSYDHWGRNTLNTHKVGAGNEMTVNQLKYNWKNELIERNIGKAPSASNYLQSLDYTYNNMGWLLTMNASGLGGTNVGMPSCPTNPAMPNPGAANATPDLNDLFYLELKYDQLQSGLAGTAQKNGNISQVIWRTRGRERQAYSLGYDYLSRMTSATYSGINDAGTANSANAWNESLTYDLRGNIQTLARTGKYKTTPTASCWTDGQIDNLSFAYWTNTNRVRTITDNAPAASKANGWNRTISWSGTSTTYNYDQNGNLTYDPDKGMDVTYNYLNLPDRMSWNNTNTFQTREIKILYDGAGRKLRKSVTDYGSALVYHQDYVNGIEYRSTSSVSLSLESIYHGEGRVFNTSVGTTSADALRYEYTIKDHLGNARLSFTDKNANGVVDVTNTASNEILQENHYYPFGLNMAGPWINDAALDNRYQYNGKELNDDFGLGWNDYGARWYDAAVGRWWAVDAMVDSFPRYNSYNYAKLNPLIFIDIRGDSAWPVNRNWSGRDVSGFSTFVNTEIDRMQNASEEFDCADLATSLLIRYASSEGLEVSFTTVEGEKISSSDANFTNVAGFESAANIRTNAQSITNDMTDIIGAPSSGDMTNNGFHVNIVTDPVPNTSYDSNGGIVPTASGSLPARVPKDSNVPINSNFKRWNVIKEAFRSRYEENKD